MSFTLLTFCISSLTTPPSLLLPDGRHFAFTSEQSLKFLWNKVSTDYYRSEFFSGIVVYFHLTYVFGKENLPSILKFAKIAPYPICSPHPPPFTFIFYLFFKFLYDSVFLFTNNILLLSTPPPPSCSIITSPTQKSKIWNLY